MCEATGQSYSGGVDLRRFPVLTERVYSVEIDQTAKEVKFGNSKSTARCN